MTDEEKLEDIDAAADALLDKADIENVGRIAHRLLKLFAGQSLADCWVAVAYALAWSARNCDDDRASGLALLGILRIMQRVQEDTDDEEPS